MTKHFKLLVLLLLLCILVLLIVLVKQQENVHPTEANKPSINDQVTALLDNRPTAISSLFTTSQVIRTDIRKGHYQKATAQLDDIRHDSQITGWAYQPFTDIVRWVANPSNVAMRHAIDKWVQQAPDNDMARVVRASYRIQLGWWVRGYRYSEQVPDKYWRRFNELLAKAREDIKHVDGALANDSFVALLRLRIISDSRSQQEVTAAFQHAKTIAPSFYALYAQRLTHLKPNWGGSIGKMKAFVAKQLDGVPANSPLHLLSLALYESLMDIASERCQPLNANEERQCVDTIMRHIAGETLSAKARQAVQQFAVAGQADGVTEVSHIIRDMMLDDGDDSYAAAFLQFMATALHSDTQLMGDTARNHYRVDLLTSRVWYLRGNDGNAITLLRRALTDLDNTIFPNVHAITQARAAIFERMAVSYAAMHRRNKAAIYSLAAARLQGGIGADPYNGYRACRALWRLGANTLGIHVCSKLVKAAGDQEAQYYLADMYQAIGEIKQAADNYQALAQNGSGWPRTSSIIDLGLLYHEAGLPKRALSWLNAYNDVFVEGNVGRDDLAIYFNNRCFEKMQLGKLIPALSDCQQSLKYGNIPDAVAKQHLLIGMLKADKHDNAKKVKATHL